MVINKKRKQLILLVTLIGTPFFSYAEGGIKSIGFLADSFTVFISILVIVSFIISLLWGRKYSTIRIIVYLLCGLSFLLWFLSVLFVGTDKSIWLNYSGFAAIGVIIGTATRKKITPPNHT